MQKAARGQRELKRHLAGQPLTYKTAVLAKCYACTCGYADGKVDCRVPKCPLYGFMPFRDDRKKPGNSLEHTENDELDTEQA